MKILKSFFTIFLTVIILSACGKDYSENKDYTNSITTLNVGQASCTLIESDGQFALVDAGRQEGYGDIKSYLIQRGVEKIDLLVISHFHYDHTSDVMDVIRNFEIGTVVIPSLSEENIPDNYFYKSLVADGENGYYTLHYAQKDETFPLGPGEIKILTDTINGENINNTSVALSFTKGDFVYVNLADMESDTDSLIWDSLPENITLYTAAHHGSGDSNSTPLLEKLSPQMVVISCGEDNDYGHPHKRFINRLEDLNIPYLITYQQGNIVYNIDNENYFTE